MVFGLLLLFPFVLPFLDGGTSFLSESLILILPLPLILLGLGRGEFQFKNLFKSVLWTWLLFLFFVGVSVFTSTSQLFSTPAFFKLIAVFLFFSLFLLTAQKKYLKYVIGLILAAGVFLSLLGFYYLLPFVSPPGDSMNLVYARHGHSHLADYLLFCLPLVLSLFLATKKTNQKQRWWWGGLLILFLTSFVLTFSRGAFLVLPPVILWLIFLSRPRAVSQKILSGLLILVPLGFLALMLVFSLSPLGLEAKFFNPDHWLVKQLVKPELQSSRLEYWQQSLEAFRARPLTGFGWGTFEIMALRFQSLPLGWSNFAHNFYLQVLGEAGLFAFFSFLAFLFFSLRRLRQGLPLYRGNPLWLGGVGAVLASALHSLVDYDWHFPAIFLIFLFLLAALLTTGPRDTRGFFKKERRAVMGLLVSLSALTFLFAQTQLIGEYYYQREDYKKGLLWSPWPPILAREAGDRLFKQANSQEGKKEVIKTLEKLLTFSREDSLTHLWLAQKYETLGDLEKAVSFYEKAIYYNPIGHYPHYLRLAKMYEQLGKDEKKEGLLTFFGQNLNRVEELPLSNRLAKSFYSVGKEYIDMGNRKKAIYWWQKAVEAAPEWSYFHLELASLYYSLEDDQEAEETIKKCLDYYFPKEHCQSYWNNQVPGFGLEPIGFWQEKIVAMPE